MDLWIDLFCGTGSATVCDASERADHMEPVTAAEEGG